jgi:CSLREA domain-containing protein
MRLSRTSRCGLALVAVTLRSATPAAPAATFTVTKTADTYDTVCDSDCSLREAIVAANGLAGADTIVVPAGTYLRGQQVAGEDAGTSGDYDITDSVTIQGAGARSTVVSASDGTTAATDRVFEVLNGDVVLHGLTVADGRAGADDGGGILNWATLRLEGVAVRASHAAYGGGIENAGDLTIDGATVAANRASSGAGIDSTGTLTAVNLTVSGNRADADGGGVAVSGSATLMSTTIAVNVAAWTGSGAGGGLVNDGVTTLQDTVLTGNSAAPGAAENCSGLSAPVSSGHNIDSGTSCELTGAGDQVATPVSIRSLRDNGGELDTHSIYPDGAAFDHGAACPATDARGVSRPQGGACDVGAFELEVADLVVAATAPQASVVAGGQATFTVTVRNAGTAAATEVGAHVGVSASAGYTVTPDAGSCTGGTCTISALAPGQTATLTVSAQSGPMSPGLPTLQMQLQASAHTRTYEQNLADNTATASIAVTPPPPPPPVTSVKLSLSAAARQRVSRRSLSIRVTCDAACTPRVSIDLLRRDGKVVRLGSVAGKPALARTTQTLKLRLSKRAIASLRKALRHRRSVDVRFVVRASTTDPGRLAGGRTLRIKVVR